MQKTCRKYIWKVLRKRVEKYTKSHIHNMFQNRVPGVHVSSGISVRNTAAHKVIRPTNGIKTMFQNIEAFDKSRSRKRQAVFNDEPG